MTSEDYRTIDRARTLLVDYPTAEHNMNDAIKQMVNISRDIAASIEKTALCFGRHVISADERAPERMVNAVELAACVEATNRFTAASIREILQSVKE